jgi:hypothetical protein
MTTLRKSVRSGWEAKDTIELGNSRLLVVTTHKGNRGQLVTYCQGCKDDGDFGVSFLLYGDFTERIATTDRCTEGTVARQHANVMEQIEAIKDRCAAFYAEKLKEAA